MEGFGLNRRRSQTGAALVELAIGLPVLVLVLIGTADFARVFYQSIEMQNAARAGAQFGAKNLSSAGNNSGIEDAASAAVNITGLNVENTAHTVCRCYTDDGTAGTIVSCTSAPSTVCTGATHRVMTVTVTVRKLFSTLSPYPGIPRTLSVVRAATMRVTE